MSIGAEGRHLASVTAVYAVLTVLMALPFSLSPGSQVVADLPDTHLYIWTLAWDAYAFLHQPLRIFDANIYYPFANTLAYSDAVLLPALIGAPLIWAGVPPLVAYTLLILSSFVAAGLGMYVLAWELTGSRGGAALAGLAFAFQSYRFAHYSHLELLWTCWIPLALWALHRVLREPTWTNGVLLGSFAVVALVLAVTGVYALLAFSVGQRRRELAVRLALGAGGGRVARLVLSTGAALTATGVAVGIALSLVATRVLKSQLFGVEATDPLTFAAAAVSLLLAASLASYLPARQAARIDPATQSRAPAPRTVSRTARYR